MSTSTINEDPFLSRRKIKELPIAVLVTLTLTGCATERAPVVEEELFSWFGFLEYSYLATAPERRVVLFRYEDRLVCAEPPADAADQVASLLTAAVRADKGPLGAGAGFTQKLDTTIKQLGRRTQALQLYRDRAWALCLMLMNGMIKTSDYVEEERASFAQALSLLYHELKPFYETFPRDYDNPNQDD